MKIKIFCDIADFNLIKKFNKKKIVTGFTTNPSLMRKAGAKDYKLYSKQILKVCRKKPISLEVFADDNNSMIKQGMIINTWGKNVYVKVPVVNSKNQFTGKVIKKLNDKNIKFESVNTDCNNSYSFITISLMIYMLLLFRLVMLRNILRILLILEQNLYHNVIAIHL